MTVENRANSMPREHIYQAIPPQIIPYQNATFFRFDEYIESVENRLTSNLDVIQLSRENNTISKNTEFPGIINWIFNEM